tara:strand:+ start:1565 stop:2290 length:726 start_codon:yes stop_codon:yes gene_type:complete
MQHIRECYLKHTNQCGGKLSNEHIISKSVIKASSLESIWIPTAKGPKKRHWSSFQAKILCEKHNSNFGNCDNEAGRLMSFLTQKDNTEITLSGSLIEIWAAKTIANFFYGGFLPKIINTSENLVISQNILNILSNKISGIDYGLCATMHHENSELIPCNTIEFNFISHDNVIYGSRVTLESFSADFIFSNKISMSDDFQLEHDLRPSSWKIREDNHERRINFTWSSIFHSKSTVISTVYKK